MEKLLMLGTSLASNEIIEYAKSQGVYTIVTDYLPPEKSIAKMISDEYWMINTGDLDTLEKKCREEQITAVMCGVSEFNLEMTMELCKRLGLPTYCTPEAWHYSRDKADFKALCKKLGVPLATDYTVSDALTEEELDAVVFPVVVKPVDMSGNRGITYCYNKDELREAYRYARSLSKNPKIVVERMLHGREWWSYYVLAQGEIRQISLNAMEAQPGELKNLYSLTTTITDNVKKFNREINPAVEKVLKAVGCKEGIAWVQEMLDDDGSFYVIEMGYRLPGDLPFMIYPQMIGFDSIKWLTDFARGIPHSVEDLPKAQESEYRSCGCGYSLWTNRAGRIGAIEGIDKILEIPGVTYHSLHQVGDDFPIHRPIGVFAVFAENCEEFCEKIDNINKTIRVLDEEGNDMIIRYTDFDYLRSNYLKGLEEK